MSFSDEELERYGRQIILPEIGGTGQARLKAASATLVGCGGLGAPAALYLAGAGVGRLVLVDDDRVALSNLQRQILFTTGDVGRLKTDTAADRLRQLNPEIIIETHAARLDEANARHYCERGDIVLDGSDNFATRAAVAAAAVALRRPLVSGAVQGFAGQLTVFTPFAHDEAPCFRCLFPDDPPADALPSCAIGGILGPVAGQIGAMMANETVKWILRLEPSLIGTLLLVDGLTAQIDRVRIGRRPGCTGGCRKANVDPREDASLAPTPSHQ